MRRTNGRGSRLSGPRAFEWSHFEPPTVNSAQVGQKHLKRHFGFMITVYSFNVVALIKFSTVKLKVLTLKCLTTHLLQKLGVLTPDPKVGRLNC